MEYLVYIIIVMLQIISVASIKDKLPCICLKEILTELKQPVYMEQMPDKNFLVADQLGIITKYSESWQYLGIFVNITHVAHFGANEQGLLSFTLHPNYSENRKFYVYYIRNITGEEYVAISEFVEQENNLEATKHTESVLLVAKQKSTKRNGGSVFFGKDGFLYISLGDGGSETSGDEHANPQAQQKDTILGKILRLDVNKISVEKTKLRQYAIPTNNPFLSENGSLPEIFAYGFRNPFRCSVDTVNGTIWCADTGNHDQDEIDIIHKGRNYGWNLKEGTLCLQPGSCTTIRNEELPIKSIHHDEGSSATLGGYVYRGNDLPQLYGRYVYADFIKGNNYLEYDFYKCYRGYNYLEHNGTSWMSHTLPVCDVSNCPCNSRAQLGTYKRSFAQDRAGELYSILTVVEPSGPNSKLMKLVTNSKDISTCNHSPKIISSNFTQIILFTVLILSFLR